MTAEESCLNKEYYESREALKMIKILYRVLLDIVKIQQNLDVTEMDDKGNQYMSSEIDFFIPLCYYVKMFV